MSAFSAVSALIVVTTFGLSAQRRDYPTRPPADAAAVRLDLPPTTVTVTPASGEKVEGVLDRIDDFVVSLTEKDGTHRSFRVSGDTPKVEVHDPLQPHKDLLRTYSDTDIHNVTAYLATLK